MFALSNMLRRLVFKHRDDDETIQNILETVNTVRTVAEENAEYLEEHQYDGWEDDSLIRPASNLPDGWKWRCYDDGSGSLFYGGNQPKVGALKTQIAYDLAPYANVGWVEVEIRDGGRKPSNWSINQDGFKAFQEWAEQYVKRLLEAESAASAERKRWQQAEKQ